MKTPKWKIIKEELIKNVANGKYQVNEPLPSETMLCHKFNVTRNTVRQALAQLEEEKIIERIKGKGSFLNISLLKEENPATKTYGLVMPEIELSPYPSIAKGFEDYFSNNGNNTIFCNTNYNIDQQANSFMRLIYHKVAGIAIIPPTIANTPAYQIHVLLRNNIPVVLCHRKVSEISAPFVGWNQYNVGCVAAQTIINKGYDDIAFIGTQNYEITQNIIKGFQYTLRTAGINLPHERICYAYPDTPVKEIKTIIQELLNGDRRPRVIFCTGNIPNHIYLVAKLNNIRVPEELGIINLTEKGKSFSDEFHVDFTAVTVNEQEVGRKAAYILSNINNFNLSSEIIIEPEIHFGETL